MDLAQIKNVVKEGVAEGLAEFKVDAETHHRHHEILELVITWAADMHSTAWRTVIRAAVIGLLSTLIVGAAVVIRGYLSK